MDDRSGVRASAPGRLAVVGGGMGGVATAWLCGGTRDVDLFEARETLGGNASSLTLRVGADEFVVDIGAESFNAGTHPMYWALLHEIGAVGGAPADDVRVRMPGTLAVLDGPTRASRFVSKHPLRTPRYALGFKRFAEEAVRFVEAEPSVDVTIGEFVDGLRLDPRFANEVLLPWLASLTCFRVEMVRTQSALSFLMQFVKVFSRNVMKRPATYGSRIGLVGIMEQLVARCDRLTVRTGTPVTKVVKADDGGWFVDTPTERHGPYAAVVVNAPPHASRSFLVEAPAALHEVLERMTYYDTDMIVHRDPVVMPANRRDWSSHNAAVLGDWCEATIWLGSSRRSVSTGKPLEVFKSWATNRSVRDDLVLAEQTFRHPSFTPATLRASTDLLRWQGHEGVWFCGTYTTITDLQETALASAIEVARALAPESLTLHRLEQRITGDGSRIETYDVA